MGCKLSFLAVILVLASESADVPETAQPKKGKGSKQLQEPPLTKVSAPSRAQRWQWQVVAALAACSTESEAEAALLQPLDEELQLTSEGELFAEVEKMIFRGWWNASRSAVLQGRKERIDLTAPVRRSVAEVKQQAEELLRWLDPNYAHPAPTLMAFQWAQNASAVTVAARFAHKWEAPGANLAVYSTDKGQGHVNKERTEALVKQLLSVSMVNHTLEAEILAKVQNSRKRFTLSLRLFDETVPEASGWSVVFRKAAGSMQMSRGAEIPELHFQMRKRWAVDWPRLTREDSLDPGERQRVESESSLTCRASGDRFYCPSSKSCVAVCSSCQDFPREKRRCIQDLSSLQAVRKPMEASFHDEDLSPAYVAGLVRWNFSAELLQAEALALCWVPSQEAKEQGGASLVTWSSQLADDQPSLRVPNGTSFRAGQHFSLVVLDGIPTQGTDQMCQENVVATAAVQDHWKPQILSAKLHFQDVAPKEMQLMGEFRLQLEANPAAMPTAVLLRWGGESGPKWRLLGETAWRMELQGELEMVGGTKDIRELLFQVSEAGAPVEVPRGATHFLAFADGPGVVGLEPIATLRFHDLRPPNEMPKSMVAADFSEFADGRMSFSFSFEPGECEDSFTCDAGSSYALYWTNGAKKLGEAIWTSQEKVGSAYTTTVTATRPPLARGLMVVARNPQGEMDAGPTAPLPVRKDMEEETDE